jgi:hypothetical protein
VQVQTMVTVWRLGSVCAGAEVNRLTVRWPSGQVQTLDGPIQTNHRLTIEEP